MKLPWFFKIIHWIIILNFLFEIIYAGAMVFFVIVPEGGGGGPLMGRATSMPFELMVTRRLYASECWIAMAGLSIYLAITEIGPRMWGLPRRGEPAQSDPGGAPR